MPTIEIHIIKPAYNRAHDRAHNRAYDRVHNRVYDNAHNDSNSHNKICI